MASTLPITLLSTLRIGVGSASFLLPSFTCSALFYPVPATSLLAVRLFGCRDLALGVLLATAKSPQARRQALLAGVAVDALDVVACVWGYGSGELGELGPMPAAAFGAGAISFLVLAAAGWRGAALGKVGAVLKKA